MTFGYDSALAFSRSRAGVETFAKDLLNRLRMMRTSREVGFCFIYVRFRLLSANCSCRPNIVQ
jgi:hypothetical protein